MKLLQSFVLFAFAFALTLSAVPTAAPASASTVDQCQVAIADLRLATENATFVGRNADREEAGLLRILDSASAELALGKNADAAKKLTDFRIKVEQLNAGGKINPDDAAILISAANAAITCIESIS